MLKKTILFISILSALYGCGGGGGSGNDTESDVSFANNIQPILSNNCTLCHVSAGGITSSGNASFLPLNSEVSYANLVNKGSTYTSGGMLVIPGNSSESVLFKRVSGITAGAQMPKDRPPLSSSDQNLIKTWIDEGALNN